MLPELSTNQRVYIEITNPTHGGQGWGLGDCLWSPVYDNRNAKSWKIMENIKQGDIVIHLVIINGEYCWVGISIAKSGIIQDLSSPPKAGNWENMYPYQRVNLNLFHRIESAQPIKLFLSRYERELKNIYTGSSFYVIYGSEKELRMAQRYIANCNKELYNLFIDYSNIINFNPAFKEAIYIPTLNEPQNPDYNAPGRIETIISRIIRDTSLSRQVKADNNWRCQICGCKIVLPNGYYYIEGHHLKPLGGKHLGPDIKENIIILCPTHHTEFDYGAIAINPETGFIEHIDSSSIYHNRKVAYYRNDLSKDFLNYHYETIFKAE